MSVRDWDEAARFIAPEAVVEWPQSRERILGRSNFIALNRDYPGDWEIFVEGVDPWGESGAVVRVRIPHGGSVEYCIGFYEVAEEMIVRATEYWAESYAAPEWRRAWVKTF